MHRDTPYSHITTGADLDTIPDNASWVLLGAKKQSADTDLHLWAVGQREDVLRQTKLDKPNSHNGVWWYRTDKSSVGFAPVSTIDQHWADVLDVDGKDRLSWYLDCDCGGWRAGTAKGLQNDNTGRKVIWYWGPSRDDVIGLASHDRTAFFTSSGYLWSCDLDSDRQTRRWLAGTGSLQSTGDDGPAAVAALGRPVGLTATAEDVFWADRTHHVVRRYHRPTHSVPRVLGVTGDPGDVFSSQLETKLKGPEAVSAHGQVLFVADTGNSRVLRCDFRSGAVSVVYEGSEPSVLCASGEQLLVADRALHQVFRVDLSTGRVVPFLGTGYRGFSGEGLPPLATHINGVLCVTQGDDGDVLVVDGHNNLVRALQLPGSDAAAPVALLADGHRWHTASIAAEAPEGIEGNVADAMMPYHAAEWHTQEQMVAGLYCSPFLTADRSSISMKLLLPEGNVSIGLVTSAPMPAEELLDHYVVFRPSWNTKTYVQPASELQGTGGTWREWFSGCLKNIQQLKPKLFGLRNSNSLKVVVNRSYDSEEDLFTWQAMELWINGKRRGEALKPFTAGVDMPVRLCLYADDFNLQLLEWPVVAQRCTERTGHGKV